MKIEVGKKYRKTTWGSNEEDHITCVSIIDDEVWVGNHDGNEVYCDNKNWVECD